MNVYVASNDINETADQLIKKLARITLQTRKTTSVIVVDDPYNLDQAIEKDADIANTVFHLRESQYEKDSITDKEITADSNQLATKLNTITTDWVVFEFGQSDQQICVDFIRKLAHYNFITPVLRDKYVVFTMPSIYLTFFARTLNESFNNLPVKSLAVKQSSQVKMLIISTKIERVFISFPLLLAPFIRLAQLMRFIHRRFVKAI